MTVLTERSAGHWDKLTISVRKWHYILVLTQPFSSVRADPEVHSRLSSSLRKHCLAPPAASLTCISEANDKNHIFLMSGYRDFIKWHVLGGDFWGNHFAQDVLHITVCMGRTSWQWQTGSSEGAMTTPSPGLLTDSFPHFLNRSKWRGGTQPRTLLSLLD